MNIGPLRDTFAALFFVSLGMLANMDFIGGNLASVAIVVVVIITAKFVICSVITRLFGYGHKTVLMAGIGTVQIGEFSLS